MRLVRVISATCYLVIVPGIALPIAALALFVGLRAWSSNLEALRLRVRRRNNRRGCDTGAGGRIGEVPPGLPSFSLPDLSLVWTLTPAALGIALMSFTVSIAAAGAFQKHGEPPAEANQELLALGMANICDRRCQRPTE